MEVLCPRALLISHFVDVFLVFSGDTYFSVPICSVFQDLIGTVNGIDTIPIRIYQHGSISNKNNVFIGKIKLKKQNKQQTNKNNTFTFMSASHVKPGDEKVGLHLRVT